MSHLSAAEVDAIAAKVEDFVRESLQKHNKAAGGSSGRIARLMLMTEPPSIDGHEITDKGYVNQRATIERRADLVQGLFTTPPADGVMSL